MLWLNKLILGHLLSAPVVSESFGGEINCLAKMHVGNADCTQRFEKAASVLTNAYCQLKKKTTILHIKHNIILKIEYFYS